MLVSYIINHLSIAPTSSSVHAGSAVDHISQPPEFKPRRRHEGYLIFDFASLHLGVARAIYPTLCTKVAVRHQIFPNIRSGE